MLFFICVTFNSLALSAENTTADAKKFMVRGRTAVEMAKDQTGFLRAAEKFKQAIAVDPDLIEAYYNLGIVLDKAGQYDEAIKNLTIYLEKSPKASDAEAVQGLIYKIEYRREATVIQAAEESQKASEEAEMNIEGVWLGDWQDPNWGILNRITKVGDEFTLNYQGVEPTGVTAGAEDMADGWRRKDYRQTFIRQE